MNWTAVVEKVTPYIVNVQIVGDVSAYRANRVTGETLPGLLIAQDLSHFHAVITHMKSVDEANQKKREAELAKQAVDNASVAPSPTEPQAQAVPARVKH